MLGSGSLKVIRRGKFHVVPQGSRVDVDLHLFSSWDIAKTPQNDHDISLSLQILSIDIRFPDLRTKEKNVKND